MRHILKFPLRILRTVFYVLLTIIIIKTGLYLVTVVEWYFASHSFLSIPPSFGKTHFIMGQQKQSVSPRPAGPEQTSVLWGTQPSTLKAVFFSPDDKVRSELLDLVQHEQQHLRIAVFMLTDKKIAYELINAHKRGVTIEIITDPTCLKDQYNKIGLLSDQGISVFVYNAQHIKGRFTSIMHNKFAIFKKNKGNKSILWTGSFNFTCAGHKCNQENVLVLDDAELVQKFARQFERLKTLSYHYKPVGERAVAVAKR